MEPVPLTSECLLRLCATAGAALSHNPQSRFTGLPCRKHRKSAPEKVLEKSVPDARSDMYVLSWVLLELGTLQMVADSCGVTQVAWMLDDGPEKAWRARSGEKNSPQELFSRMASLKRSHRPADWQELGFLLSALVVPSEMPWDGPDWVFPVFAASSRRLGLFAWMAAVRVLSLGQVLLFILLIAIFVGIWWFS